MKVKGSRLLPTDSTQEGVCFRQQDCELYRGRGLFGGVGAVGSEAIIAERWRARESMIASYIGVEASLEVSVPLAHKQSWQ